MGENFMEVTRFVFSVAFSRDSEFLFGLDRAVVAQATFLLDGVPSPKMRKRFPRCGWLVL